LPQNCRILFRTAKKNHPKRKEKNIKTAAVAGINQNFLIKLLSQASKNLKTTKKMNKTRTIQQKTTLLHLKQIINKNNTVALVICK